MKKTIYFLVTVITLMGLCGCGSSAKENYLGGEGEIKADGLLLYDDNNIYSGFGYNTLYKYNKKSNSFSLACVDPGCDHSETRCKAKMYYSFFNGGLIKCQNDIVYYSDGTGGFQGYLYLCGETDKQVFKNERPEEVNKNGEDAQICGVVALNDDYLALHNGLYIYILDAEFNIVYTVIGVGTYAGGVYYMGDAIYYIDNLYRLQKIDMESSKPSPVDLGEMKIVQGFVDGEMLWFTTGEELCTYDYKTGEVKVRAEHALSINNVGKYIQLYYAYEVSENVYNGKTYLYDKESGEIRDWDGHGNDLVFHDGVYYKYDEENGELTLYEEDLSTVIKTADLE